VDKTSRTQRAIATNGLPLKIQTQWTENSYTDQDEYGNITTVDVNGWLVRINGKKYPRQLGEDGIDWTYRYTTKDRRQAIENALQEARLTIW
tara:strand:+ start:561 stop:836 length:276 start_codon:yes stop_codon:yes gene_type:complete